MILEMLRTGQATPFSARFLLVVTLLNGYTCSPYNHTPKESVMKFTKMQGAGNDYVYVNCFEERVENPGQLAVRASNRNFGIGSDGLILILPSEKADVRMRMFNSDGSESEMCGNGIRCVAKYAYDHGIVNKKEITAETGAGVLSLQLFPDQDNRIGKVRVNMGNPRLTRAEIPMLGEGGEQVVSLPLNI